MNTYYIANHQIQAQDCAQGFFINPALPENFDFTPNEDRPFEHMIWWMRPFIEGEAGAWSVRILDGGAHDRSSWVGDYVELGEAVKACQELVLKPRFFAKAEPIPGTKSGFGMTPLAF